MDTVYIKGDSVIFQSLKFVYEVTIHCYFENYYCIVNSALFESEIFLENVVESYFLNKHIQISSELYSAPLEYIEEEGYKQEVPLAKKPRKSKKE